ncbi:MAG: DUF3368 domain-containing protein [Saprospiraceae bacterium]
MTVISDTSGISALIQIGQLHLLESLFQEIIIPQKVSDELMLLAKFGVDMNEFASARWIHVVQPSPTPLLQHLSKTLHPGESFAIALAIELNADLLIVDDGEARRMAAQMNIPHTGIAGVLIRAKSRGLLPAVKPVLDEIIARANFRLHPKTHQKILELAGE